MSTLQHTSKNCWEVFSSDKEKAAMHSIALRYIDFLSTCKTERETIEYVKKRLADAGITEGITKTTAVISLQDKTIFIAKKGKTPLAKGLRMLCAHADTPASI